MSRICPRALDTQLVRTDPSPAILQRIQSLQIRSVNVSESQAAIGHTVQGEA